MKRPLPANAKIAKDAKETVQEALSEFISFVTSEASDRCSAEKRKTISGEDLIHSLDMVGFESYTACLGSYLRNFRDVQRHQNEAKLGAQVEAVQSSTLPENLSSMGTEEEHFVFNEPVNTELYPAAAADPQDYPPTKRARLEGDEQIMGVAAALADAPALEAVLPEGPETTEEHPGLPQ
eukprot:TRINITY_DN10208_c0_g1_i4.p1 TRINITY_DN10208_c0_g1~~TRINITY_DN10208_c0_g1_i4.p1  ORF type:complete len:180 (+),score=38.74 TRINITY_DN10208_c0_g1_i4:275-814(+)